jgi:hypothetical protein
MTVNTLGSESRLGGDSFAPGSSRGSRTVAEWLWPFLVGGVALFSISALFYYHFHRAELEPQSFLQQVFAGLYDTFGWAPSVVFFLLVFAWSLIWFVTGVLEKPVSRVVRLLVMAVMLGVFLNLGDGGVVSEPHKGAFGAWLAGRLVGAIGYVPSLVMVWVTTFASLLLATDWFFSEWFERSRKAATFEVGVEEQVTDHLRGLSEIANRPESTEAAAASAAVTIDAADAPADGAAVGIDEQRDDDGPDRQDAAGGDPAEPEAAAEPVVHVERRLSYAERRRLRAERDAGQAEPPVPVPRPDPQPAEEPSSRPDPEPAELARAVGSALDELAENAQAGGAAVSEDELAGLFGDASATAEDDDDVVVVAPEHVEAEEIELVDEDEDAEAVDDDETAEDEIAEEGDDESEDAELGELDEDDESDDVDVDEDEDDDEEEEEEEDEDYGEEDVDEDDEESAELESDDDEIEDEELEDEEFEGEELDEEEEEEEEEEEDDEGEYAEYDEDEELEEGDEEYEEEGESDADDADDSGDDEVELEAQLDDEEADDEQADEEEFEADEDDDDDDDDFVESTADAPTEPEETVVAIPRPDEMPEPVQPTPPVSPAARAEAEPQPEPSAPGRQQKLFGGGVDEDLLVEARELLRSGRRPTAALLQRKLRIDYELAQDVLHELEARGLLAEDEA